MYSYICIDNILLINKQLILLIARHCCTLFWKDFLEKFADCFPNNWVIDLIISTQLKFLYKRNFGWRHNLGNPHLRNDTNVQAALQFN